MIYPWHQKFVTAEGIQRGLLRYLQQERGLDVVDLASDMEAQDQGIDFLVRGETAELKACERVGDTGNVAFEIIGNFGQAKVGSALRSTAKWLFYYDVQNHVCHVMLMRGLIRALDMSDQSIWSVCKAKTLGGNGFYSAWSLLVPLRWIREQKGLAYQRLELREWLSLNMENR